MYSSSRSSREQYGRLVESREFLERIPYGVEPLVPVRGMLRRERPSSQGGT